MSYTYRDNDQCNSGVHFQWVDATVGDRWDLDDSRYLHTRIPGDSVAATVYLLQCNL